MLSSRYTSGSEVKQELTTTAPVKDPPLPRLTMYTGRRRCPRRVKGQMQSPKMISYLLDIPNIFITRFSSTCPSDTEGISQWDPSKGRQDVLQVTNSKSLMQTRVIQAPARVVIPEQNSEFPQSACFHYRPVTTSDTQPVTSQIIATLSANMVDTKFKISTVGLVIG